MKYHHRLTSKSKTLYVVFVILFSKISPSLGQEIFTDQFEDPGPLKAFEIVIDSSIKPDPESVPDYDTVGVRPISALADPDGNIIQEFCSLA